MTQVQVNVKKSSLERFVKVGTLSLVEEELNDLQTQRLEIQDQELIDDEENKNLATNLSYLNANSAQQLRES